LAIAKQNARQETVQQISKGKKEKKKMIRKSIKRIDICSWKREGESKDTREQQ